LAITGESHSWSASEDDFVVLKLDPSGNIQWARDYGLGAQEYGRCIIQTSDGGYAVGGLWLGVVNLYDFALLKLDPSGNLEWVRAFGYDSYDFCNSVIQTTDGGYALAGVTGGTSSDLLIVKLDGSGNFQWASKIGGTAREESFSVVQTPDGGLAVGGYTSSFGAGSEDFFLVKLSSDGTFLWAKTYGGTGSDVALAMTQSLGGTIIMAGYSTSWGSGQDLMVVGIEPYSGNLLWARTFGGPGEDKAFGVGPTVDEGCVLLCRFAGTQNEFLVMRLDQGGNYPNCVADCAPTVYAVSPSITPLFAGLTSCSPYSRTPTPIVSTVTKPITDVCEPLHAEESPARDSTIWIRCVPVPGGALFVSFGIMNIRIYSVDGRVVYSGELQGGRSRIPLETGVYIWQAGQYRGRAVVK
jgi:hypothetical protein